MRRNERALTRESYMDEFDLSHRSRTERIETERQWWRELRALSDANNVAGFYAHYAKYLEANNLTSTYRQIIHKMATGAVSLAKDLKVAKLKGFGSLANNLCPDHRDKQTGKPCLACAIENLESERAELIERILDSDARYEQFWKDSVRAEMAQLRQENLTLRQALRADQIVPGSPMFQ